MDKHLIVVELDNQDSSFKQLLDYKYINFKSEGKDNIFISKEQAWQVMADFVRLQVQKGLLIPQEGYLIDSPTIEQVKEVAEFMKNSGF